MWETDATYCLLENHMNESLKKYISGMQIDMNKTYF